MEYGQEFEVLGSKDYKEGQCGMMIETYEGKREQVVGFYEDPKGENIRPELLEPLRRKVWTLKEDFRYNGPCKFNPMDLGCLDSLTSPEDLEADPLVFQAFYED